MDTKITKLSYLRSQIRGIMEAMHTNMAIAVLNEVVIDDDDSYLIDNHYKVYVTRDKGSDDLNFFSMCGVHMSWLTLCDNLPVNIKYMELIKILDIAECKLLEY